MKYVKYLLFLILVLALIFFGRGLLTPSISYENEITVEKSAEETYAVMSDPSIMADWIEGFKRTELISGTENTVGAVSKIYVEDSGGEMVMQETITAIKANEHIAMDFTMDFMDMEYAMYLEEKDGATNIRSTSKTMGNGIFAKSILSFMSKAMKEEEDKNLSKLKTLIENNTKDYFQEPVMELPVNQ